MTMRYKLIISYDGSGFQGYQIQDAVRTVQGELEKAIQKIVKVPVTTHSSGRTDSKVHAKGQVVHFDANLDISSLDMRDALNATLPSDIYARTCSRVSDEFHSRYSAKEKEYEYLINIGEYNPLLRNYVLQYCRQLDIEKMQEALSYIIGEHDFASFASKIVDSEDKNTVRTITSAVVRTSGTRISIKVRGTGFLRHMVRGIVGTLILVGNDKIEPIEMKNILEAKDRSKAGPNADGCGLYLLSVSY